MRKMYPIMLGCYEKGDKCIVAGKDDILGNYSMFICRLKHQVDYGAEVEPENIGNVIAQLHFCNIRAARAFRDIVTKMVNDWEADHAERERQWISVKDRLPDMCGCKCLVAAINQFGQKDVFTAFTGYMEHGKLEFHSCEPTHEITAWTITHWMPLPEPPADCGRRLTEGESK